MSIPHPKHVITRIRTVLPVLLLVAGILFAAGCQKPVRTIRKEADFDFNQGRYEKASGLYDQILQRQPGDWEAQYHYGVCMLNLGQVSRARHALELALAANPTDNQIAFALAEVLFEEGDTKRLYQLLQSRGTDPRNVHAYLLLADYAIRLNDADSAMEAINIAITYDQGATTAPYIQAARLAEHLADSEQAIRRLRQAYAIDPDDEYVNEALVEYGEIPGPTLGLPAGR